MPVLEFFGSITVKSIGTKHSVKLMRSQQSHPTQKRLKREAIPCSLRAITSKSTDLIHVTLPLCLHSRSLC